MQDLQDQAPLTRASQLIPRLKLVAPGLIRGGQPSLEGLRQLQLAGVKTIINLRYEKERLSNEEQMVKQLGMQYVSLPMNGLIEPSPAAIVQFLRIVRNPANQPVFVHCLHGQDRTGAMIGIYHIDVDGWDAATAYTDMLKNGFHSIFVPLADAVFDFAEAKGRGAHRPIGVVARDLLGRDREVDYYRSKANL